MGRLKLFIRHNMPPVAQGGERGGDVEGPG